MTSEIKVDTISEQTSANGVTIDGLTIKDGNIIGDVALAGTTPTFTIGDGGAEDAALIFDGNAQDFYIALDDSADDLIIGRGSTVGTSADIQLNADGDIGIATAPNNVDSGRTLHIKGHNSDGANIRLQSTGDTADTDDMVIQKNDTVGFIKLFGGDTFKVFTSNAERLAIDADGVVSITTSGNGDNLSLISTDADGSIGPNLRLYRNSSSPADNDDLATIDFEGRNDNSQDVQYGMIRAILKDASDGTEDGLLEFHHMKNGSLAPSLQIGPDECVINESSNDYDFRVESNGNTHMLFVDGGNNAVGIGTSTLDAQVHILKNDSGALLDANADNLFIEDNTTGITIGSSNSGEGHIRFSDSDDADVGAIGYFHSDNYMNFRADGAEVFRISDAGLHIGGTGDANALDDYEEGTWTPSGASLGVATVHKAIYRKIGDIVFLYCDITMNSSPSDTAQATSLAGFPFTCNDDYFQCNSRVAGLNQTIEANIAGTGAVFRDKSDGVICTRSEFAGDRCQHIFIYTIA